VCSHSENMSRASDRIFRAAAIERLSSPEQLDQLVRITRPLDWAAILAIGLALTVVVVWSLVGRIATRAPGEGILIIGGGKVVDAVSAAAGRLASQDVSVGDHVSQGQLIARIAQTDTEQRHRNAVQVYREREREHADLNARIDAELSAKARNFAKLETAFEQIIRVTNQRVEYLTGEVKNLEGLLAKGITTRRNVEDRRRELTDAQQRREDAQNEILKLRAQRLDLETQRAKDREDSQFRLNDARRQMEQLAGELERNSRVMSPIDGRVIEIKVSTGSVLAIGTPVIQIESEGLTLAAVVYLTGDRGKDVKPGMEVRIEPTTVRREEFGSLIGTVRTISDFPMTPQGMLAVLHNDTLVSRFSRDGAPYAVVAELQHDDTTPTGYRWSAGRGPQTRLTTGTLIRAEITTRERRPIDLVLPNIKRLTGLGG
jgi:HlyD family secretion protein